MKSIYTHKTRGQPLQFPVNSYFKMLNCIAISFNPTQIPLAPTAFKCVVKSTSQMIPPTSHVSIEIYQYLKDNPIPENATNLNLIDWCYNFQSYVHNKTHLTPFMDRRTFDTVYNPERIDMKFWGNPHWDCIHYFAAQSDGSKEYGQIYKAFVSCLQFLLPCGRCRRHLMENLAQHHIDEYMNTTDGLFKWSYILHQRVNSAKGLQGISYEEAKRLYHINT